MRRVRKASTAHQQAAVATPPLPMPLDYGTVTLAMIQALIPLGLRAVEEALQQEVTALAGARYAHHDGAPGVMRWGQQAGSIYLADQKLPITVPRVRDQQAGCEVPLATYATLQTPRAIRGCFGASSAASRVASTKPPPRPCAKRLAWPNRQCHAASCGRVHVRCGSSMNAAMTMRRGWCCCSMARRSPPSSW